MNSRSFITISMLIFIVILFLSGFIIEVGEEIAEMIYEDESEAPASLLFFMSFLTATHVLSGIFFVLLSVFHIIKNWSALKNHLKIKNAKISKAFILALAWIPLTALLAYLCVVFIKGEWIFAILKKRRRNDD
jgi:cytochrome bd-type quinol oxidase subunit 2